MRRLSTPAYRPEKGLGKQTMRHFLDVVSTFALGAELLVGIGLIVFSSTALELLR